MTLECFYDDTPPPHASDGFKTDSAPFLPHSFYFLLTRPVHVDVIINTSLSRVFCSIWPPIAVNILYFQVYTIGGRRNNFCCLGSTSVYVACTSDSERQ